MFEGTSGTSLRISMKLGTDIKHNLEEHIGTYACNFLKSKPTETLATASVFMFLNANKDLESQLSGVFITFMFQDAIC